MPQTSRKNFGVNPYIGYNTIITSNQTYFPPAYSVHLYTTVKVLRGHSKIDKTKISMTNGSLMKLDISEAVKIPIPKGLYQ